MNLNANPYAEYEGREEAGKADDMLVAGDVQTGELETSPGQETSAICGECVFCGKCMYLEKGGKCDDYYIRQADQTAKEEGIGCFRRWKLRRAIKRQLKEKRIGQSRTKNDIDDAAATLIEKCSYTDMLEILYRYVTDKKATAMFDGALREDKKNPALINFYQAQENKILEMTAETGVMMY